MKWCSRNSLFRRKRGQTFENLATANLENSKHERSQHFRYDNKLMQQLESKQLAVFIRYSGERKDRQNSGTSALLPRITNA